MGAIAPLRVPTREEVETGAHGITIDFTLYPRLAFKIKNIDRCRLTGQAGPQHRLAKANIITSEIDRLTAKKCNWSTVDVKDCVIRGSSFEGCSFADSVTLACAIGNTIYRNCRFHYVAINDTTFVNVRFQKCDLRDMVIKNCTFIRCSFEACTTNNKMFEHCIFDQCRFPHTDLWFEAVLENFGISSRQVERARVRIAGRWHAGRERARAACTSFLDESRATLSPLEELRAEFFRRDSLLSVPDQVDRALDLKKWPPGCRNPSTFCTLLNSFTSFLLQEYDRNHLPLSPLLRLYYASSRLSEEARQRQAAQSVAQDVLIAGIYSAYMRLLPLVEQFLDLHQKFLPHPGTNLHMLVEGPQDENYFRAILTEFLQSVDFRIVELRPAHSPAELILAFLNMVPVVGLISLFLASRLKVEITKLQMRAVNTSTPPTEPASGTSEVANEVERPKELARQQILTFEMGKVPDAYRVRVAALLPGQMLASFRIEVGLGFLLRVKKVLIDLLGSRRIEKGP